jgi:hypothetical protein
LRRIKDKFSFFWTKRTILLLICCTTVISSFVSIIASTSVLEIDEAYYKLDETREISIHVTGALKKGGSPKECKFRLTIPENFTIETLTNGSPVLKLLHNGSAAEVTSHGNKFHAVFVLETYNSTLLPRFYYLEVTSSTQTYSDIITPQWQETQEESVITGGPCGPTPYIAGTNTYDTYKGNSVHIRTVIYNPSYFCEKVVLYLQYCITANEYNDWINRWTPLYLENGYLPPLHSYIVHDYLVPIFTADQSNKIYAFNGGSFKLSKVKAGGSGMGGAWQDEFEPRYPFERDFDVNIQSGTHRVFIVYLFNNQWLTAGFSEPSTKIYEASQYFWDYYTVLTIPINYGSMDWDPPDGYTTQELLDQLRIDTKDKLGLTRDWSVTRGTHADNHGFDVAAGFTGYWSDHFGYATKNHLVVTGGHVLPLYDSQVENMFQHELSHCYKAEDRWDYELWYGQPSVMSKPGGLFECNNWGWVDYDIMYPRRGQFDGR